MNKSKFTKVVRSAAPLLGQHAREIQAFRTVVRMPLVHADGQAAESN